MSLRNGTSPRRTTSLQALDEDIFGASRLNFTSALIDGWTRLSAGVGPWTLAQVALAVARPLAEVSRSWAEPNGIRDRWIQAGFFITTA